MTWPIVTRSSNIQATRMKILAIFVLLPFQFAVRGAEIPTNTPPPVATNFFRNLPSLLITDFGPKGEGWESLGKARAQIVELGPSVLPVLVAEMNKTNYISDPEAIGFDERWGMRMRLASVVQSISGEDFKCNTSVHGWNRDYSFNAINDWWTNKVLRR
jgi:hypothetical protein